MKSNLRAIVYSSIFGLVSSVASGQVLLNEGFTSGIPGTWTVNDVDGLAINTSANNFSQAGWHGVDSNGEPCAGSTSWYSPAGASNDWLITPQLSIPAGGANMIWKGLTPDPAYMDSYEVLVSTTNTNPASFTMIADIDPESTSWADHSASLSAYGGQNIYVAFRQYSNDMYLLYIDQVKVFVPSPNDASLATAGFGSYKAGTRNLEVEVQNMGNNAITSLDITYALDGSGATVPFGSLNIPSGGSQTLTIPNVVISVGDHDLTCALANVNAGADPDMGNNNYAISYNAISDVPNNQVANWKMKDSDGDQHELYTYIGNGAIVLYDFFASWCGPCANAAQPISNWADTHSENVQIFGFTTDPGDDAVVVNGLGWGSTYPKFPTSTGNDDLYAQYALGGIPMFVLICPNMASPQNSTVLYHDAGWGTGMLAEWDALITNDCSEASVENLTGLESVSCFPNPASDELTIQYTSLAEMTVEIRITDVNGSIIKSLEPHNGFGANEIKVDLSDVDAGVYFVLINSNGLIQTQQIVVQ